MSNVFLAGLLMLVLANVTDGVVSGLFAVLSIAYGVLFLVQLATEGKRP